MVKKLLNFLGKKTNYYDFDENEVENNSNNNNNNLLSQKECNKIIKENGKLKENLVKQALEKFKTRRSIRKFSDQKIEWKKIYDIIEAGFNGPVAGGVQNYKVIVIEDQKEKKELGKLAFQQYWLSDAPYILVVIRDNHRLLQLYPSEGEIYSIQNSAAMIENMIMMAHFYDLGTCWVEAYDNSVLKEYLSIPMHFKVDAIIPIGYPLENPKVEKDPIDAHLYYQKYGNLNK